MEKEPNNLEKICYIGLDSYLEFISGLNTLDGEVIEDETEAFFVWVTENNPALQDIDGVSLIALYRKNVINGGMDTARFFGYCSDHNFPYPNIDSEESILLWRQFSDFIDEINVEKKNEYETWAKKKGIETNPRAVTIFFDVEGNKYRVRTDFDHYGEIIR